jgi:ribonuclease HI
MRVNIWTDGGCSGNPGPGGWAFVVTNFHGKIIGQGKGGELETTNNRMELLAVIKALKYVSRKDFNIDLITVHTDSQYVEKGMTEWVLRWKMNGWKTSDQKPVKNIDLWLKLDKLSLELPVTWQWVESHIGIPLNERCDKMTHDAIKSLLSRQLKPEPKNPAKPTQTLKQTKARVSK